MASFINAGDILAVAVEMERRGRAFYLEAAKAAVDDAGKGLFNFMAGEETQHEKTFQAMLDRLGGLNMPVGADDKEYLEYARAALDAQRLFTREGGLKPGSDPYYTALKLEKDSILYFSAMLELVPEGEKPLIQDCINEEKKHILLLGKRKNLV
jgi:rubrerythrin